jgi:hypothetical protein
MSRAGTARSAGKTIGTNTTITFLRRFLDAITASWRTTWNPLDTAALAVIAAAVSAGDFRMHIGSTIPPILDCYLLPISTRRFNIGLTTTERLYAHLQSLAELLGTATKDNRKKQNKNHE